MQKGPLSKNQDISLTIDALTSEGQGVGRYDGFAVFVPFTLPGEEIEARIIKPYPSYAIGRLNRIDTIAPERVEPACGVFQKCGGCQLQHMEYGAQLCAKRRMLVDALERLGGFKNADAITGPTLGSSPYAYRNKGSFPVRDVEGVARAGLFAPRSHRLIPVERCPIAMDEVNAALGVVTGWLESMHVRGYDEASHSGDVRHVVIRAAAGGVMVVIVTAGAKLPHADALIELFDKSGVASCLIHNINRARTNTVLGGKSKLLWGKPLAEELGGLDFSVSEHSFLQVNRKQAQRLYAAAKDALELDGTQSVLDAYCGIGTIALSLAPYAKSVVGIETVEQAIVDARSNAASNRISNAEFYAGEVERVLPELIKGGAHFDAVVLDPPRKGCERAVIDALIGSGAGRIVYVSCNPATLARDAALLREGGYEPLSVVPVDMFPQSAHVEAVMAMRRRD